jgi:hypothetical protein
MIRHSITPILLTLALSAPAMAQSPAPASPPVDTAADTDALRAGIHQQLQACWSVPPGFAESGLSITVTLHVSGDGALWADPEIEVSEKTAAKAAGLIASIERAVARCAPFTGFAGFGAQTDEKFSVAVIFTGH